MRKGARDSSLNLQFRQAVIEELDALLNLENICFKEETFQRKQLNYLLGKAKSIVLVTTINGIIIGSMIILLRKHILNARIYSLNVHPDHRRKGIASSLMDSAIRRLKKNGYKNITLEAGVNNQGAQNLYLSKGFLVDKTLSNYYKDGGDALHFKRKL